LRTLGISPEQNLPETHSFPPLSHYINHLRAMGHVVEAVTTGYVAEGCVFEADNLSVRVVPRRRSGVGRDLLRQERLGLAEVIAASDAEIVHAHWTYEYAHAAQASGKPCIITAHDAPFGILRYMRPLHFWFAHALLSLPVLYRSGELCVISPYLEKYFRRMHFYRRPIHVVPEFLAPATRSLFREKNLDNEFPIFASVNISWGPRKNVDTLLRAFVMVRQSIPGARLILFGRPYGPGELAENYARAHGLAQGVEFRGPTPNTALVNQLANEVDFLVHPSREESFCVSLADAMAMGIPVIGGSNSGAVPWLLEEGACGMLTDINDEKEVASAMVRLVQDDSLARSLRENARLRIEKHFRLEQVAEKYFGLYEKKVERKS
jgi:glycosyltransferase involved in cell wall biosynthesis